MCIDKHHWKCCCGCSLTTATLIMGILEAVSVLGALGQHNWISAVFSLAMTCIFAVALCDKNCPKKRKFLY